MAQTNEDLRRGFAHFSVKLTPAAPSYVPVSIQTPMEPESIEDKPGHGLLGKFAGILHKTMRGQHDLLSTTDGSVPLASSGQSTTVGLTPTQQKLETPKPHHKLVSTSERASASSTMIGLPRLLPGHVPRLTVKETKHVSLEYDPKTRRKVLNTYEIIREIGRGEHGKVKLARDLVSDQLVAIKIVSRKLKRDRLLRMRRLPNAPPHCRLRSDYETKIRREIAIMKRCDHKYIVKLREVLDDLGLFKIYLVLEYMDRGEIKWKRQHPIEVPRPLEPSNGNCGEECYGNKIPCQTDVKRVSVAGMGTATEDNDLLSNEFSPNLTFRQSRRIFRDVLLGLEYLHMQGIVHRDIKPANLLVSSDYTVKISDFGVSFASSLSSSDDGVCFNDMELAKTVGTPAFFAPELCQTTSLHANSISNLNVVDSDSKTQINESINVPRTPSLSSAVPKVDHKIDIWAFGVTLYCLLFGRVPFNADNEFALFDVIVHEPLQFPESISAFYPPQEVTVDEFELAKDLICKMLEKDSVLRIDIVDIKQHPFVLMDLESDLEKLHDLFFLNEDYIADGNDRNGVFTLQQPTPEDLSASVVGVGRRIRSDLLRALNSSDIDMGRRLVMRLERSSSVASSSSSSFLAGLEGQSHTILLLEAVSCLPETEASATPTEKGTVVAAALTSPLLPSFTVPEPTSRGLTVARGPALIVDTGRQTAHASLCLPLSCVSPRMLLKGQTGAARLSTPMAQSAASAAHTAASAPKTPSAALSGLLLQDVVEGEVVRRDSLGGEAPQIETKRNVGGDLYLKNQSALDAIKDIQKSDNRRRASSLFLSLSRSPSLSGGRKSSDLAPALVRGIPKSSADVNAEGAAVSNSKIKIGPISIEGNRRRLSVISLPLTESFASLDSDNDDYLNRKYDEFRKHRSAAKHDEIAKKGSESICSDPAGTTSTSDPFFSPFGDTFKNFSLSSLMTPKSLKSNTRETEKGAEVDTEIEPVEPRASGRPHGVFPTLSLGCLSSAELDSCLSSSSSSGHSSDSDEEEGNLTLKFTSKLAPRDRPPYLSLSNRALSHDSRLPKFASGFIASPHAQYEMPFTFHSGVIEYEDVPESLLGKALEGVSAELTPTSNTPSVKSSRVCTAENATVAHGRSMTTSPSPSGSRSVKEEDNRYKVPSKQAVQTSPLRWEVGRSEGGELPNHSKSRETGSSKDQGSLNSGYFNNHYKKERTTAPSPLSKHLQDEFGARRKKERPGYMRSNSISVAILQNERVTQDEM